MYVEEIKNKQGKKVYRTVLIRQSYKKKGKVKHRTIANISRLPASQIVQIKAVLSGKGAFVSEKELKTSNSREYGASAAFLDIGKRLGLDKLLYSRQEQWRDDLMAMIAGRIVFQGSKLHLSNLFMDSAMWELCGHPYGIKINVNKHCYLPLDKLLERQESIQKELAKRHLEDGCLILYDMTNTWLEGEYTDSEIVDHGLGKGRKKGYKQIAIGLIADKRGCPVAIEVFNGHTSDQTTVKDQAELLANTYGVKEIIFAGDRGMLTPKRIEEVTEYGFKTLTALTHPQIFQLLEREVIQPELFDERRIEEVKDPDNPRIRYMLCKNPHTMLRERETRDSLVEKVSSEFEKIAKIKKKRSKEKVCARIGALLGRYRIGKFYKWSVSDTGAVEWSLDSELIERERLFDGCYIIRTEIGADKMSAAEAVAGYKSLAGVEKAFRNLKTVSLEIRPIYHKKDDRIRAHVFICMLAYYIQWHATECLEPLFESNSTNADSRWSFQIVIERLKSIRKENLNIKGIQVGSKITTPDEEQQKILDLLGVKIW
jgi:transposase